MKKLEKGINDIKDPELSLYMMTEILIELDDIKDLQARNRSAFHDIKHDIGKLMENTDQAKQSMINLNAKMNHVKQAQSTEDITIWDSIEGTNLRLEKLEALVTTVCEDIRRITGSEMPS